MSEPLRLGIVGTGAIAHELAAAAQGSPSVVVTGVASRDLARAKAFAADYDLEHAHGGYASLMATVRRSTRSTSRRRTATTPSGQSPRYERENTCCARSRSP